MRKQGYYSAVILGAVVEKDVAIAFAEKCKPHSTEEIIEAFISSIVSGELKIKPTEVTADE